MDQELVQYLDVRFQHLDERFGRIEQRLDGHDRRFDSIDQRFNRVEQRLDEHDQRFDEVKRYTGVLVEGLRHELQRVPGFQIRCRGARPCALLHALSRGYPLLLSCNGSWRGEGEGELSAASCARHFMI